MARHAYTLGHIEVFEVNGKRGTYHVAVDLNDNTVECDCDCGYFRKSPWKIRDTRLCRHAKEALLHLVTMNKDKIIEALDGLDTDGTVEVVKAAFALLPSDRQVELMQEWENE